MNAGARALPRAAAWLLAASILAVGASVSAASRQAGRESTVGYPAVIEELVLPGSELEAAAQERESPIVLRVRSVSPHGTLFRYDLEWSGLEPGDHDLRPYLRRKDGSGTDDLPPIPVRVLSVLPSGQVLPHPPEGGALPRFGGYRALMIALGVVWTAGLAAILWSRRKRRAVAEAARHRPRTLAERLRPLVERAMAGQLSTAERSELELGLVAWWRRKLDLGDRTPQETLALLRRHAEAGPLLQGLEDWLHRPTPPTDVDVGRLLAPYRDLPADALELPESAAAARGG